MLNSTLKTLAASAALVLSASAAYAADYIEPSGSRSHNTYYLENIHSAGAVVDFEWVNDGMTEKTFTLIPEIVEAIPGSTFTITYKAHSEGEGSYSTVHEDLRFTAAYVFTDWYGTGEWTFLTSYGNTAPNHNVYGNYDEVMNIEQALEVPSDVTVGTEGRIRIIYSNAWSVPGAYSTLPASTDHSQANPNSQALSDGPAVDVRVKAVSDPSAIGEIAVEESNAPVEYFNMQGMRVDADNLNSGLYIRRQGNKAVKVLINK